MQNDMSILFPVSYKTPAASTSNNSQTSNAGKIFANTLKGVTTDGSNTPPIRSAKATERYEWLMQEAKADPEKAAMWAQLYAYDSLDSPMVDMSDLPIMRLTATGEIYTPGMQTSYSKIRNAMQGNRSALYESEMVKGTPAIQILDKILAYNDSLPENFRKLAGW